MKPITRILAAVDFSESSNLAFRVAVGLAKMLSAELHVFHAFEAPMAFLNFPASSLPAAFIDKARDLVARKLEKSRGTAVAAGVKAKSQLGTAPTAPAIVDMARRLGVDLIVMGTRGHTGLKHVLLGSVAERTVRDAPCAVLAVKGAGIAASKPVERILVAVDFSEDSNRALDSAVEFSKQFGAELHIAHALDLRFPVVAPYEVVVPTCFIDEARQAAASKLNTMVQKAATEGVRGISHMSEVPAVSAIVDLAEKLGADLVVMGTRGRTGLKHVLLGSVAERTLRHAPCSVLTAKASSE
jgi:nucleotide-binding universal stress UspA family protein